MRIWVCRFKNAGVAGYAEAFRPVQSDSQTSEWYSYFENDVLAEKRMKYMRSIHFRKKTCFVSIASGRWYTVWTCAACEFVSQTWQKATEQNRSFFVRMRLMYLILFLLLLLRQLLRKGKNGDRNYWNIWGRTRNGWMSGSAGSRGFPSATVKVLI